MKKVLLVICSILFFSNLAWGQGKPYTGPDDSAGDPANMRIGYMAGNRVFLFFRNTTEMANCCGTQYSKWPNNDNGMAMTDGVALWIGAETYIENDSIPAPWNPSANADTLFFVQTNYREHVDLNNNGDLRWTLWPPKGYSNTGSDFLAMSNISESWPADGWPTGDGLLYSGLWNGRFGWGKVSAQLETFFVANDAQDQEYLQPNRRVKYYPRPNRFIGEKDPSVTKSVGQPWGGLGIRVETRGMQWSNPQTQDAIFWEYTIANVSDYDIPKSAFGYYIDMGIGINDEYDEIGYYDVLLDLSFAWDIDMISVGGRQPGVMGCAFLESPGISSDNTDNDDDGIIDEKRDNLATTFYEDPMQGVSDLEKFIAAYGEPKPHWDADEDHDWRDGIDENGDGIYQPDEYFGDDVGIDGISPLDFLIYEGPDADGSEGNHKPDYSQEQFKGEPNFAITDISESDMIGLTTFLVDALPGADEYQPKNDRLAYKTMTEGTFKPWHGQPENLCLLFAASPFPMYQGQTEHISMAMIHSTDYISFGDDTPSVPLLARKKEVVQVIYDRDYRFATPPEMPTLTATPADGRVILSWNDVAERFTTEPLLDNINDFEGYKLYKSTDRYFSDATVVTNGFGEPTLRKPVYQCDLVDGISDFADFGLVDGVAFYLGSETGIEHYYIDTDVKNGVTYYYALVAYDYGIKEIGDGITPFENSVVLDLDEYGQIRNQGINVAIVTPTQLAAGFVPPTVNIESGLDENNTISTNPVGMGVIDHLSTNSDKKYKIKWISTDVDSLKVRDKRSIYDVKFITSGFEVFEVVNDSTEISLFIENSDSINYKRENMIEVNYNGLWPAARLHYPIGEPVRSSLVDGVQVGFIPQVLDPAIDPNTSGWVTGDADVDIFPSVYESSFFPWEYEIVFTDNPEAYTTKCNFARSTVTPGGQRPPESSFHLDQSFSFYVINKSFVDSSGNHPTVDLLAWDKDEDGEFDLMKDEVLVGHEVYDDEKIRWGGTILGINFSETDEMPENGDVYRINFLRPLSERDSVIYTVNEAVNVVEEKLDEKMDDIKVVPNPYVSTNQMEPNLSLKGLNQQRRLMFTNLPAQCSIKIFTVSGVVVDEIQVDNFAEKGTYQWDMLTKEGLEIAAGMYIFHVKSDKTGKEKIGKFAVLK